MRKEVKATIRKDLTFIVTDMATMVAMVTTVDMAIDPINRPIAMAFCVATTRASGATAETIGGETIAIMAACRSLGKIRHLAFEHAGGFAGVRKISSGDRQLFVGGAAFLCSPEMKDCSRFAYQGGL